MTRCCERQRRRKQYYPNGTRVPDAHEDGRYTGTAQSPLLDQLPYPRDATSLIKADACGEVSAADGVWTGGDCAAIPMRDGRPDAAARALRDARRSDEIGRNLLALIPAARSGSRSRCPQTWRRVRARPSQRGRTALRRAAARPARVAADLAGLHDALPALGAQICSKQSSTGSGCCRGVHGRDIASVTTKDRIGVATKEMLQEEDGQAIIREGDAGDGDVHRALGPCGGGAFQRWRTTSGCSRRSGRAITSVAIAVLEDVRRTATVRAIGPVEVLRVSARGHAPSAQRPSRHSEGRWRHVKMQGTARESRARTTQTGSRSALARARALAPARRLPLRPRPRPRPRTARPRTRPRPRTMQFHFRRASTKVERWHCFGRLARLAVALPTQSRSARRARTSRRSNASSARSTARTRSSRWRDREAAEAAPYVCDGTETNVSVAVWFDAALGDSFDATTAGVRLEGRPSGDTMSGTVTLSDGTTHTLRQPPRMASRVSIATAARQVSSEVGSLLEDGRDTAEPFDAVAGTLGTTTSTSVSGSAVMSSQVSPSTSRHRRSRRPRSARPPRPSMLQSSSDYIHRGRLATGMHRRDDVQRPRHVQRDGHLHVRDGVHGRCVRGNRWRDQLLRLPVLPILRRSKNRRGGHGTCPATGACTCASGFAGTACDPCTTTSTGSKSLPILPDATRLRRTRNVQLEPGHCACSSGFAGAREVGACDACAPGFFDFPFVPLLQSSDDLRRPRNVRRNRRVRVQLQLSQARRAAPARRTASSSPRVGSARHRRRAALTAPYGASRLVHMR